MITILDVVFNPANKNFTKSITDWAYDHISVYDAPEFAKFVIDFFRLLEEKTRSDLPPNSRLTDVKRMGSFLGYIEEATSDPGNFVYECMTIRKDIVNDYPNFWENMNDRFEYLHFIYSYITEDANHIIKKSKNVNETTKARAVLSAIEHENKEFELKAEAIKNKSANLTEKEIAGKIKEKLIGQDEAVNEFTSIICERQKIAEHHLLPQPEVVLLVGPTGCGKTQMVKEAEVLFPGTAFTYVNAKDLGMGGSWYGVSIESIVSTVVGTIKKKQYKSAVVFIDEFDKICKSMKDHNGADVNTAVQETFLTILSGTKVYSNGSPFGTENILFVLAGTFDHVFGNEYEQNLSIQENLIKGGMIPEIAGRITSVIPMNALTVNDYLKILTNGKDNCINQTKEVYETIHKTELVVSDKCLKEIAVVASELKLGARGMNSILQKALRKNLASEYDKFELTPAMIRDSLLISNRYNFKRS